MNDRDPQPDTENSNRSTKMDFARGLRNWHLELTCQLEVRDTPEWTGVNPEILAEHKLWATLPKAVDFVIESDFDSAPIGIQIGGWGLRGLKRGLEVEAAIRASTSIDQWAMVRKDALHFYGIHVQGFADALVAWAREKGFREEPFLYQLWAQLKQHYQIGARGTLTVHGRLTVFPHQIQEKFDAEHNAHRALEALAEGILVDLIEIKAVALDVELTLDPLHTLRAPVQFTLPIQKRMIQAPKHQGARAELVRLWPEFGCGDLPAVLRDEAAAPLADDRSPVSTARRNARMLKTRAMYLIWKSEYKKLKKKNPKLSDVACSKRIAKMPIAQGLSDETIRKHMKYKK